MSPNSNKAWNTKYGPRRVRDEAPTLDEAIAVAQGLSDELDAQTEIAASRMGLFRSITSPPYVAIGCVHGSGVSAPHRRGRA